jgi:hypothetical protein
MSSIGIGSLDQSVEKANTWLARIADELTNSSGGKHGRGVRPRLGAGTSIFPLSRLCDHMT